MKHSWQKTSVLFLRSFFGTYPYDCLKEKTAENYLLIPGKHATAALIKPYSHLIYFLIFGFLYSNFHYLPMQKQLLKSTQEKRHSWDSKLIKITYNQDNIFEKYLGRSPLFSYGVKFLRCSLTNIKSKLLRVNNKRILHMF